VGEVGGQAQTRRYPCINHALALGALATPLRWTAPVMRDTAAFIDLHTRTPGSAGA
jgi:hypothetical protein